MAVRRTRLLLWASTIPLLAVRATETSAASTSTGGFDLGPEITAFIPSCAISCFQSFLEVNFEDDLCSLSPSLQCLCAHTGSTGYTIGEGAVQCIVAENSIGACQGMSAGSDTVANAYGMCNNQPNAAPVTHATIIATLVVPPTGPVVVPNPSTTATMSLNKSSTRSYMTPSVTMAPTRSLGPVLPSSSSTFITRTSSSLSASSAAPTGATSAAAAAAAPPPPPTTLSTAQIGGIAGGSAAAVILAAMVASWCLIRRRRGKAVTGFYRVRDSWSPRRKDSPEISAPRYREPKSMSFTRALAQQRANNNRASARPDTIGLAISPEGTGIMGAATQQPGEGGVIGAASVPAAAARGAQGNFNFSAAGQEQAVQQQQQQQQQQNQQASAAKPALTVAIPAPKTQQQAKRSSTVSNSRMPFSGGHDSVVTEFAEDGEISAGLGSAQIWRPPNTDPQSASTYYVADKWGNWVLGGGSNNPGAEQQQQQQHVVEMPTPVSKTVAERRADSGVVQESSAVRAAVRDLAASPTLGGSTPAPAPAPASAAAPVGLRLSRPVGAPGRPTIRHVAPESGRLPINTRSSSVYSNFSLPQMAQPGPENPMPTASPAAAGARGKEPSPNVETYYYAGSKQHGRDLTSSRQGRRSGSAAGGARDRTNTMMSQESATTIASSVGSEVGVDSFRQSSAADQQGSLSPVVESPGRSPVSYPRIPRPHSSAQLLNNNNNSNRPAGTARPPQHPGLRVVNGAPSDSPTLGAGGPQARARTRTSYYGSSNNSNNSINLPPTRNPNPNRNPGQVRSGSPETAPPAGEDEQQQQQQQEEEEDDEVPRPLAVPGNRRDAGARSPPQPAQQQPLQSFRQHIISSRSQLPSQSHSRYGPMSVYDAYSRTESDLQRQQQQQQQYQQQRQQQYQQQQQQQQQNHHHHPYQNRDESSGPYAAAAASYPSPSPSASNVTLGTVDSQSSLLAAKRLGAERAAALQIGDSAAARQARWKRRSSSLGQGGGGGGGDRARGSDVPLPATPGWKPQLTPKRRGDDLFLSVR